MSWVEQLKKTTEEFGAEEVVKRAFEIKTKCKCSTEEALRLTSGGCEYAGLKPNSKGFVFCPKWATNLKLIKDCKKCITCKKCETCRRRCKH